jgi:hypothetical protein
VVASHHSSGYSGRVASHYAKIRDMPSKHRYRAMTPRPPDEVREAFMAAVTKAGSDANAVLVAFMRWFAGETDELPARPPKDG